MSTYRMFLKDLFLDTIGEILYFPVWWYSRGLKKTAIFCWRLVNDGWRALALSIFIKNFFKPMYGQHGWDAYVLSISIHFLQLILRLFLMVLWASSCLIILITWILLPAFIIYQLI